MRWETEQSLNIKLCEDYSTKNYQHLIIGFHVTVENVGDVFLGHNVCRLHALPGKAILERFILCRVGR